MGPVVEREILLERLEGDHELLGELVELFLSDCPRLLDEIRAAVAAGDGDQLMRAAHTLKGSVSNFCAPAAADAAQALEGFGRDGDLARAPEGMARLEALVKRVTEELGRLAQGAGVA